MERRANHSIRTVTLDVEFQDQSNRAFELKNTLSRFCKDDLLPAIELLFDQRTRKGRNIKIDKIVLDIGVIEKEDWKKVLIDKVVHELVNYFTDIKEHKFSQLGAGKEIVSVNEDGSELQAILHFLKTGLLPWYTAIKSKEEFVQYLHNALHNQEAFVQIMGIVAKDEYVLNRFVEQTPVTVLDSVIRSKGYAIILQGFFESWKAIVLKCFADEQVYKESKLAYCAVFQIMSANPSVSFSSITQIDLVNKWIFKQMKANHVNTGSSINEIDLLNSLIVEKIHNNKNQWKSFKAVMTDAGTFKELKANQVDTGLVLMSIQRLVFAIQKNERTNAEDTKSKLQGKATTGLQNGGDPVHEIRVNRKKHGELPGNVDDAWHKERADKMIREELTENGLYIANAGLVILHPFLVRLFENVGYSEDKKWLSINHQQRAILLTQYMVTGVQAYPEFDLLLNKVLLGYPVEETLAGDMVLSDFEMQEANDVLKAVCKHWQVLKNTSTEGLQTTFLQRDGKLLFKEGHWALQVEQKTVDILLNKLPWGISILKLPWMESRLHVEWV